MKPDEVHLDSFNGALPRTANKRSMHAVLSHPMFMALVNLAIGLVAYACAWIVRIAVKLPFTQDLLPQERWDVVNHPWWILILSQIFLLYIFGLMDDLRTTRYREIVALVFAACFLQVLLVTSVFFLFQHIFPRTVVLVFGGFNFMLLTSWHIYVKAQLGKQTLRVLVVGRDVGAASGIIQEIEKSPWMGMKIVGLLLREPDQAKVSDYPLLGGLEAIESVTRQQNIDQIIFVSEDSWKDRTLRSLSRLQEETALQIAIVPSVYEIVIGRLRHINIQDTPLIEVRRNPNEPFERSLKRLFDVVLSGVLLLLLSPFLLVLPLLIKVFSPGPAFYLQERVGYQGRVFRLVKFRTMIPDAESNSGEVYATENDPRVTPIGRVLRRFRLDELPQLINVLKGEMSFVGPRPERPKFVEAFERDVPGYAERHKIKPGITGLAQVRSCYHTAPENKLRYDLAYIYNYSFSLDLLVLLETIKVVLIRKGS